ncbi:MAG: XrtA-associated tyrosine autokinase [Deltaproteobacteria bacterium]
MSRIEDAIESAMKRRGAGFAPASGVAEIEAQQEYPARPGKEAVRINRDNPNLIAINTSGKPEIAEEYRKLKSIIVRYSKNEGFRNTFVVTSSLGMEGKSLTALNIAVTMAQEYDHTVLLVDADIRKPSIASYLGIEAARGVTDCLIDGVDLGDAIIKTDIGKLSFLPAGKRVDNPVELLSSQKMKNIITEIKTRYSNRYIIIDTPPILPFAETRTLSLLADGVVFVVRESCASESNIKEAFELLGGSNLLGVVYNAATVGPGRSNHYYGY